MILYEFIILLFKYIWKVGSNRYNALIRTFYVKYLKLLSLLNKSSDLKDIYKDLTPIDSYDTYKIYIDSLDWALSRDNVLNIAVTGPYGSGKSSILKTFKNSRPHYQYFTISLATFHTYTNNKDAEQGEYKNIADSNSTIESLSEEEIEKRILQQLFYKVHSKKALFSRFRKIGHIKALDILKYLILIMITAFLFTLFITPNFFLKLWEGLSNNYSVLQDMNIPWFAIIGGFLLLSWLLVKLFIYFIIVAFRNFRISKVKVKSAEVEVNAADDKSIFNRYLDEILYYFEVNPYQIVYIEDLDRFNNIQMFMKLRELNSLLNNAEQIKQKIVFIYAIKDDLFVNKDRTKFFDYMLPVIPVISSTNSGEKLWNQIVDNRLSDELSEADVKDICLYIDDMRILNNIYNEYIVYREKLMRSDTTFLEPQRMFALIVYKNIYPNDFAKLQFNSGLLYSVFESKKLIVAKEVASLKEKIKLLKNKLNEIENEHLRSKKELKLIYWYETVGENNNVQAIQSNNQQYTYSQFFQDNFELSILNGNVRSTQYHDPSYMTKEKHDILLERMNNIHNKFDGYKDDIYKEIEEITNKIKYMESWSLKQVINEIGLEKVFLENTSDNSLMIFLLRNGYIDEMYPLYMNHFYEGSLTYFDMKYIMHIKDRKKLNFEHPLNNIDMVLSRLDPVEFERVEILNYDIMNFLLEHDTKYKEQLDAIMHQLSNEEEDSFSFIDSYLDIGKDSPKFIRELSRKWYNIWIYIYEESLLTKERQEKYLRLILLYAEIDDIENMGLEEDIISNMKHFLEFLPGSTNRAKEIIEYLDIRFSTLELTQQSDIELFEFIITYNYHMLNPHMISLIARYKSGDNEDVTFDINTKNLTTIKKINFIPLWNYIQENLEFYIRSVFFELKENTEEDEEIVIDLINSNLPEKIRKEILKRQSVLITDIGSIPIELWECVASKNKMKPSWNNVISLYDKDNKFISELIEYLNISDNFIELSEETMDYNSEFEEEVYKAFSEDLIRCNDINSEAFGYLYKSLPYRYDFFQCDELTTERLNDVVKYNLFKFTAENFECIRTNHTKFLPYFICKNIKNFLTGITDYEVDDEDIYNLLSYDEISYDDRLLILEKLVDRISCDTTEYANAICTVIFSSNKSLKLSEQLIKDILEQDIPQDKKIKLIAEHGDTLNNDTIIYYIEHLSTPYSRMMEERKQPTIKYTKENEKLVEMLKARNLISSYKQKGNNIRVVANYK